MWTDPSGLKKDKGEDGGGTGGPGDWTPGHRSLFSLFTAEVQNRTSGHRFSNAVVHTEGRGVAMPRKPGPKRPIGDLTDPQGMAQRATEYLEWLLIKNFPELTVEGRRGYLRYFIEMMGKPLANHGQGR